MSFKKSVVIVGRFLYLAGIGACLKSEECLEGCEMDRHDPDTCQNLEAMIPAVILLDLSDTPSDLDVNLLQQRLGLLLIGVDPSSGEVFVLKG